MYKIFFNKQKAWLALIILIHSICIYTMHEPKKALTTFPTKYSDEFFDFSSDEFCLKDAKDNVLKTYKRVMYERDQKPDIYDAEGRWLRYGQDDRSVDDKIKKKVNELGGRYFNVYVENGKKEIVCFYDKIRAFCFVLNEKFDQLLPLLKELDAKGKIIKWRSKDFDYLRDLRNTDHQEMAMKLKKAQEKWEKLKSAHKKFKNKVLKEKGPEALAALKKLKEKLKKEQEEKSKKEEQEKHF